MSATRFHSDFAMLGSVGAATTSGGMAAQQRRTRRGREAGPTREDIRDAAMAGASASVPGGSARGPRPVAPADDDGWVDAASITFVALSDMMTVSLS